MCGVSGYVYTYSKSYLQNVILMYCMPESKSCLLKNTIHTAEMAWGTIHIKSCMVRVTIKMDVTSHIWSLKKYWSSLWWLRLSWQDQILKAATFLIIWWRSKPWWHLKRIEEPVTSGHFKNVASGVVACPKNKKKCEYWLCCSCVCPLVNQSVPLGITVKLVN